MRWFMGLDESDSSYTVLVFDEAGEEVYRRDVQHTANGLAEFGGWVNARVAEGVELLACLERPHGRIGAVVQEFQDLQRDKREEADGAHDSQPGEHGRTRGAVPAMRRGVGLVGQAAFHRSGASLVWVQVSSLGQAGKEKSGVSRIGG